MKPSQLRAFVAKAHKSLINPQTGRPDVVLSRVVDRRLLKCQQRWQATWVPPSTASPSTEPLLAQTSRSDSPLDFRKQSSTKPSSKATFQPTLPISCPGCGALAQELDTEEPGYYSRTRKNVKLYLKWQRDGQNLDGDGSVVAEDDVSTPPLDDLPHQIQTHAVNSTPHAVPTPVCDRCHDLIHYARGTSIPHPSVDDIADSIEESGFERNHVYHVLDAADFPCSLIPSIVSKLDLARQRSQNRRSRPFSSKPTLSFIITRSDLLGPTKEHVDSLLPYFRTVLRKALGRYGENLRLGNVHLVSAKRGWWTKEIKDDIWNRGGGNWMVGKFNVGKSNLFEVLFPKASGDRAPLHPGSPEQQSTPATQDTYLPETSLLPPPQPETPFPVLPLVSSLPGTTASPIRVPFGNNRGELIDLPGLDRGDLERYIQADHKLDIVMTSRPKVAQHNIKPGQSLLLGGGVVRITPCVDDLDPDMVLMAFPFVSLEAHVTSTEKAIGVQNQERQSGIKSILAEGVGSTMKSAGVFVLDTDVTRRHAAPLLRAGVDPSRLPFQVFSTDILIEGVGWVELACQIRRRRREALQTTSETEQTKSKSDGADQLMALSSNHADDVQPVAFALNAGPNHHSRDFYPVVEVFSPGGKFISQRTSMDAWTLWKDGLRNKGKKKDERVRPRNFVAGSRRRVKLAR